MTGGSLLAYEYCHRQFFERNRTVQLVIDPESGSVVDANPAACAFYGYSLDELRALRIWQINTLPEDQVRSVMRQALHNWSPPLAFHHRLASGDQRQVEVHTGPLEVDGRTYLHSLVFDVTERKRAEASLLRLRLAFDLSRDGLAILGPDERYDYVNTAHATIHGYSGPRELVGRSWRQLYDPVEIERLERTVLPVLRREGAWHGPAFGLRQDGSHFAQEVTLTRLPEGGLACVVRDVTAPQAALAALRASEERYRTILANIEEGYYESDLRGQILFANEALRRLLGGGSDGALRSSYRAYADAQNVRKLHHDFRAVFETGRACASAEWELISKDGRRRTVSASVSLIREAEQAVGFRGLVRDISERREAETALRESEERYRRLVELSPLGIAVHCAGQLVFVNQAALRMLGATETGQVLGRSVVDFVHPDSRVQVAERLRQLAHGQEAPLTEERFVRLDGSVIDVAVAALPFQFGQRPAVQLVAADISAQKRNERLQAALFRIAATASSVDNLQALFTQVHAIVGELTYARNFYIALFDPAAGLLSFPYYVDEIDPPPPPQALGRGLTEYVLRTGRPLLADPPRFEQLLAQGEVEHQGASSLDWLGVPLLSAGQAFGVLVVQSYSDAQRFNIADRELLTYVSQHVASAIERTRAADALRESEARFRTLAQTAPCAIVIYAEHGFLYANDAALTITGRSRELLGTTPFWELVAPDLRELMRERTLERLRRADPTPSRFELRLLRPDGSARWLDYSVGLIPYGARPAMLATAFDITERKRAEEQIRHLAYHDTLTGLPNRLLFRDRLEIAVAQAHRDQRHVAVLFLDLDRFKAINDSMGHSQGDHLLQDVARRLERCVREGDTVARLSGDEFTLLLPGLPQALDAAKAAEKILEVLRQPFELKGREVFVTTSLGISLYPDDGTDVETLIKNADTAMYRAKEEGRDGYQLYAPAMNASAFERLALENAFRRAVLQEELQVHYQPIYAAGTGGIVAVEALLRWRHEGQAVPPSEFIALAEMTGLIVPLGQSMLRRVCAQVRQWQQRLRPGLMANVNLSARQFQQPDLVEQVRRALLDTGLPAATLDLEVTETSAMQHGESTSRALHGLKALGVRLSIDDFGVGYSSLSYLKRLPFDALKIDQSFVHDVPDDKDDAAIVTAAIDIAHALGRTVVAEGVETEEQRAFLVEHGCDRMQGFLLSPPLPPEELERLLTVDARPAAG